MQSLYTNIYIQIYTEFHANAYIIYIWNTRRMKHNDPAGIGNAM